MTVPLLFFRTLSFFHSFEIGPPILMYFCYSTSPFWSGTLFQFLLPRQGVLRFSCHDHEKNPRSFSESYVSFFSLFVM